jgi:RNA dependent RNA polymerase
MPLIDHLLEDLPSASSHPSRGLFEVLVHPSHVELNGPIEPSENSVLDHNRDIVDHFLRIRFVDNGMKTLKAEAGVSLDKIIDRRVIPILRGQSQSLLPFRARLEFLGYTMSSLKRRKAVWFLCSWDTFENAATVRDRIGAWNVQSNQGLANFLPNGERVCL